MFVQEATDEYEKALKAGQKAAKERASRGESPNLPVLDELITDMAMEAPHNLGILEIPADLIVGTKTAGRRTAFTAGFLPLLEPDSEFAIKWIGLYSAHVGDEGIREPIECYEYLGKFYVQEGNKRVSVLKWNGASSIPGRATRLIPAYSDEPVIRQYYEFMDFYKVTGMYGFQCRLPGSYHQLLQILGGSPEEPWDRQKRQSITTALVYFRKAFQKLGGDALKIGVGDALLVWLRVYSLEEIKTLTAADLELCLSSIWNDVRAISLSQPISVKAEPTEESKSGSLLSKLLPNSRPGRLNIAFINEYSPEASNWCNSHERARLYLEDTFPHQISTRSYNNVTPGSDAELIFAQAIADGADIIFATAPSLVDNCMKASISHPEIRILNCSMDVPYTGIRTYYCRVYEAKFITGAIAGAMSKDGRIGYVGSYPIHGEPASINAFALGAQMTNPNAKVYLDWTCTPGNPMARFRREGFSVISNRDVPSTDRSYHEYGTYQVLEDGSLQTLASPYWNWGKFYETVVRSILDGTWDKDKAKSGQAINYWWGLRSGAVDVVLDNGLPEGVKQLAGILRQGLLDGTVDPFLRRLVAQDGTCKNDGSRQLSLEELLHMDWLCENVVGTIPTYEEVLPMAKSVVKLQGVFKEKIPTAKEIDLG